MSILMKFFIAFSILVCTGGVFAMSLSDVGKVYLFSGMSGVMTLDGKPVKNAKLVRTVNREKPKTDTTMTDENGNFTFPAVTERTITKFLPQEFVVSQKIVAHYSSKEYLIWEGIKRAKEEFVESRGKPLVVACELNSEIKHVSIGATFIVGLCTWDVESDPPINWDEMGVFDEDIKKPESKL